MTHCKLVLLFLLILFFYPSIYSNEALFDNLLVTKGAEPLLGVVDLNNSQPSNLTSLESEPSASILGCVSVISGDYTDAAVDYVIPGPDPLPIQRIYSSGEHRSGSLCYGTSWGKYGVLHREKIEAKKNNTENHAIIVGGGGCRTRYVEDGYHDYKLHKECCEKGLVNTAFGIIGGRTNPLNNKLVSDKKKEWFSLTSGGGVVSTFKKYGTSNLFMLQQESKPNGLKVVYNYDFKNTLVGISSQNRNGKNLASYKCELNRCGFDITTDNNRHICYTFEKLKNPGGYQHYLQNIKSSEKPYETFEYAAPDSKTPHRLIKKNRPEGRAIGIEYFDKGINEAPFGNVDIPDREDPRYGRVKAIKAPVGHDSSLQYIYKFKYYVNTSWTYVGHGKGDNGSDYIQEIHHGDTSVFDVYNRLTKYFYNNDHRLTSVEKFQGTGPKHYLYARERLFWDGHKLAVRTFETRDGWTQYARQYDYDDRGNIRRDTLWGNLTGHNTQPIIYPPSGYPEYNGCEIDFRLYTYSDDGLNLMTSMTEGKTAHTSYTYYPETDLLAAKFTGPIGSIALREFNEYDENGVLVTQIQDDGTTSDKEDLTGATIRLVKRILPTTTCPVGLPLIIEEKYIDLETGYEGFIQKIVQTYTSEGWLSKKEVYDMNGVFAYSERWEYDVHGNVIFYEDPAGRTTKKSYDANFNLVYEQGPSPDIHTEYLYDYSDRLIKKEFVCESGQRLSEEYLYDLRSNLIATIDAYGNQTSHAYDEFDRRIKTTFPIVLDESGQPYSPQQKVNFNELSYPTEITDCRGFITEKKLTATGKPYKISHPDGSVDNFVYNVDGTIHKQHHKNGSYTSYEYDYQKRPTKKETFSTSGELLDGIYTTYSGFHILSETTLGGINTQYKYDACGRLIQTTQGSSVVQFVHDSMGRIILVKTFYGPASDDFIAKATVYDVLSQIVEERDEDSAGNILKKQTYEYNLSGNRIRTTEFTATGTAVTSIRYNAFGQPIEVVDAEGNRTTSHYDYNKYNELGQLVPYEETTDAMGILTATTKDALGRTALVIKKNIMGKEIQKTRLFYDGNGNQTRREDTVFNPDSTTRKVVTSWQYDSCNRLVGLTEAVEEPEQKHTEFLYNEFGQKACTIKPDGTQLFCTYDQLGRLLDHSSSDKSFFHRYTYDIRGNVIYVEDQINNRGAIRHYDNDNRLIEETLANGLIVNYSYDAMNRPVSITLFDRSGIQYTYRADKMKEIQRCDQNGIPIFTHTYEMYDLQGLLRAEKYAGNAGYSQYTYDILGRLISYQSPYWNESIHAYDKVGNLLSRNVKDAVGVIPCAYAYDDLYQLKQESGISSDSFEWDSLYNRISKNDLQHTYNALNQLISDGTDAFIYDPNGNLIQRKSSNSEIYYDYDALDRLVSITNDSIQYRYTYDELNRRQTKSKYIQSENDWLFVSKERFLYINQNEIGVVDSQNRLVQCRTLGVGKGAEIGATVLIELNGQAFVPIHDHNGNISCLLDIETGLPIETYRHTAFGEERIYNKNGTQIDTAINPWRFLSKRVDEESSFVYFGRRYYSPREGRWITADPIGFEGGPNLYAYVLNNPITHFDLYGLSDAASADTSWSSMFSMDRVRSFGDSALKTAGSAFEGFGLHCIPFPDAQDHVRSIGVILRGEHLRDFKGWRENQSCCKSLGLPEKHPLHRVVVIGGILTTHDDMKQRAEAFSAAIGGHNVHYIYNSTHGTSADGGESILQKCNIETRSVRVATRYIRGLIGEMGGVDGGGIINLFGHSQGGLISDNMGDRLNERERERLNVRTFGSATLIPEKKFGTVVNYVSENDPIQVVQWLGKIKNLFSTEERTIVHILPSNEHYDHAWDGVAYQKAIQQELQSLNNTLSGAK